MRTKQAILVVVLVTGFCLSFLPQSARAQQRVGLGGKFVGDLPFVTGSLEFDQFGIEAGGGIKSASTESYGYSYEMSLSYYLANGRYIFPLNAPVQPYLGGGLVGLNATVTAGYDEMEETVSAGSNGYDVFGGIKFPMHDYGFPISISGGVNYLGFEDLTFTYEGESISYPLGISGTSFHVGLQFEF